MVNHQVRPQVRPMSLAASTSLKTPDPLSQTFAALGDPTRRAILVRLSKGEASVTELAQPFMGQMSAPAISKHLKVLENAGLITRGREAQWRPCKINGQPLKEISDWLEHYRRHWEESLDRLGVYLSEITAHVGAEKKGVKKSSKNGNKKGKKHGKKK